MQEEPSNSPVEQQSVSSKEYSELLGCVDARLAKERDERELALVAQEHRLIPALSNLISAFLTSDMDQRRRLLPKAGAAVFWCLIPSSGTAGIGIVAGLSLFFAWQQTQLLNAQNQKIEVQNILSEAQRRSGLMFETSAIFQQIEEEKKMANKSKSKVFCNNNKKDVCWSSKGTSVLFVPSNATVGRLAALTQALRPYRYLSVEDDGPYRFQGDEKSKDICENTFNTALLDFAATVARGNVVGPEGKADPDPTDIQSIQEAILQESNKLGLSSGLDGWEGTVKRSIARLFAQISNFTLAGGEVSSTSISCKASSPERGQLLVALHAASIDISFIAEKGADFRFADLPAAKLQGIILQHVDLSNARLPGALFHDAVLEDVNFSGAHLAGARFHRAKVNRVNFSNAIIQGNGVQATNASLLFSRLEDSSLDGVRLIDIGGDIPFYERWCLSRKLAERIEIVPSSTRAGLQRENNNLISLDDFALLTETRTSSDGTPSVMLGIIIKKRMTRRDTFFSYSSGGSRILISYDPFSACDYNRKSADQPSIPANSASFHR